MSSLLSTIIIQIHYRSMIITECLNMLGTVLGARKSRNEDEVAALLQLMVAERGA